MTKFMPTYQLILTGYNYIYCICGKNRTIKNLSFQDSEYIAIFGEIIILFPILYTGQWNLNCISTL